MSIDTRVKTLTKFLTMANPFDLTTVWKVFDEAMSKRSHPTPPHFTLLQMWDQKGTHLEYAKNVLAIGCWLTTTLDHMVKWLGRDTWFTEDGPKLYCDGDRVALYEIDILIKPHIDFISQMWQKGYYNFIRACLDAIDKKSSFGSLVANVKKICTQNPPVAAHLKMTGTIWMATNNSFDIDDGDCINLETMAQLCPKILKMITEHLPKAFCLDEKHMTQWNAYVRGLYPSDYDKLPPHLHRLFTLPPNMSVIEDPVERKKWYHKVVVWRAGAYKAMHPHLRDLVGWTRCPTNNPQDKDVRFPPGFYPEEEARRILIARDAEEKKKKVDTFGSMEKEWKLLLNRLNDGELEMHYEQKISKLDRPQLAEIVEDTKPSPIPTKKKKSNEDNDNDDDNKKLSIPNDITIDDTSISVLSNSTKGGRPKKLMKEMQKGEWGIGCSICQCVGTFTDETLERAGLSPSDIQHYVQEERKIVDNLWEHPPKAFKLIRAYKKISSCIKNHSTCKERLAKGDESLVPPLFRRNNDLETYMKNQKRNK